MLGHKIDHRHLTLKVQNVEFEIDVSVSTLMYSWSRIHQNLISNTHLHGIIRPHRKFEIWFSMHFRPQIRHAALSVIDAYDQFYDLASKYKDKQIESVPDHTIIS